MENPKSENYMQLPNPENCNSEVVVPDIFLRDFEKHPRNDLEYCNGSIKVQNAMGGRSSEFVDTCDNETFRNKCPASCYACATGKQGQKIKISRNNNEEQIKKSRKNFITNKKNLKNNYQINSTLDPEISYKIFDKLNYKRALINSYKIQKKEESFLNELLNRFN